MGLHQIKKFLHSKRNDKQNEKANMGEKIFANHVSDKGLISKMQKEFKQPNSKKQNKTKEQPVETWAENLNRHFPPKNTKTANKFISNHQGHANQNHSEIPPHTC